MHYVLLIVLILVILINSYIGSNRNKIKEGLESKDKEYNAKGAKSFLNKILSGFTLWWDIWPQYAPTKWKKADYEGLDYLWVTLLTILQVIWILLFTLFLILFFGGIYCLGLITISFIVWFIQLIGYCIPLHIINGPTTKSKTKKAA